MVRAKKSKDSPSHFEDEGGSILILFNNFDIYGLNVCFYKEEIEECCLYRKSNYMKKLVIDP